ncbi:MAG: PQQ-dependent sugar dehydrogenase [Lautropia sp.]|nr:PQQ-dependent sugar dehydrogenase [Lautropia sp.]
MRRIAAAGAAGALGIAAGAAQGQAPSATVALEAASEKTRFRLVTIAENLERPWSVAFLPDGRMLVTEKPGRLRLIGPDGRISPPIANLPEIYARGQGGLLDVVPSPGFASDRTIFFSYSEPTRDGARSAVARAVLDGEALSQVKVIFRQAQDPPGGHHWGSRLVFAPDGNLFVTLGDRFNHRERAQDVSSHFGKIVRIAPDGSVPPDNPFVKTPGALPEIWSMGHRNLQGATLHPGTRQLWTSEHGAQGGDEINLALPGSNYGWPIITHGVDYSGAPIGVGSEKVGMEQPVLHWTPSIAPSGLAFYDAERFPAWRGNLFSGSLKDRMLVRLELEGNRVVHQERLLETLRERIRDVRQGPDGFLYLLTDAAAGRLLRLEPVGL